MFNNLAQHPSTLPPSVRSSPALDPQLPRGECGYLKTDPESRSGGKTRCDCRCFYPADERIKTTCGCGHQAWHHEAEPVPMVSIAEHRSVVQELQRVTRKLTTLEHSFIHERRRHAEVEKTWNVLHQKQYQNMKHLKIYMDDKVEDVVDKTTDNSDSLTSLTKRVDYIDDELMELENRLERLDPGGGGRQSRSLTPALGGAILDKDGEAVMTDVRRELPIRTLERRAPPSTWTARVVFVPRKNQRYVYEYDSLAMQRCQSRGLQQEVTFSGSDSTSFINTIETVFRQVIRGRAWMPLVGYRPEDEPFGRIMLCTLSDNQLDKALWTHSFIDSHCIAHDKLQGDLLYVALMSDDLSWTEIRWLTPVPGSDDTCWQHSEELDGPTKGGYKSLDESVYDYSYPDPPPYSSRTQSQVSRRTSGLDLLANASALHPLSRASDATSIRSFSRRSASEASASGISERSLPATSTMMPETIMSDDDGHQDKRIRTKASVPSSMGTSSSGSITSPPTQMYFSGRTKRKLSSNTKLKEPLHINVSGWTPMKTIRSMHAGNKDKHAESR